MRYAARARRLTPHEKWGDTLTALPVVATPVGSECQMVQGDWLETK
ncbi:hypothetical protein HMPREF0591_0308, partial [Mycobacterium parascrofulaceum ATCC BAA-614]